MENSWSLLKRFQQRDGTESQPDQTRTDGRRQASMRGQVANAGSPANDASLALGAIGMEDELIRGRISHMMERLEDVASLKNDFASLLDPLAAFASEYSQARAKLLESEAILARERDTHAALAQEVRAIRSENLKSKDQIASLKVQNDDLKERSNEYEQGLASLRRELRERETLAADLDRQIRTEAERASVLAEENAALRAEAQAHDAAVARQEHELAETRQANEVLEYDNRRLRGAATEQANRIAALSTATAERDHELQASRQQVIDLETKLKAEQSLRRRLETLLEGERSTSQTTIGSLQTKAEGLTSRLGALEKLLASTRDQLRERSEELKTTERAVREALVAKNNLERRNEFLQAEVAQIAEAAETAQRANAELVDQCGTLATALQGKESTVTRLEQRATTLVERIDQLTAESGKERQAFEAKIAALAEELQREKSERAIAQGALEMARRSRVEIHREFLRIKKMRPDASEEESAQNEEQRFSVIKRELS
jgi:crescentin